MIAMKTGDLMGDLRKVPTKTVYTPQELAARAMLAALKTALVVMPKSNFDCIDRVRRQAVVDAIAQAEAAGIGGPT